MGFPLWVRLHDLPTLKRHLKRSLQKTLFSIPNNTALSEYMCVCVWGGGSVCIQVSERTT